MKLKRKKMILVTSPPACGKTYLSKKLAKKLKNCVYLDKDTLIVLSKKIFEVANQPYNRSSQFFEDNIRNEEYCAIIDLGLEALDYNNTVLINAPFTREIRNKEYMDNLKELCEKKKADLFLIWIQTDKEVCHKRMIKRNSNRDTWKLEHWDEYIKNVNFEIPNTVEKLFIYKNSTNKEANTSMYYLLKILNIHSKKNICKSILKKQIK